MAQIRLATNDEVASLPHFDYTKLTAINTCPTWGLVRYHHHKTMPGFGRAMALEAGKVMHECFSAIRLMTLAHWQNKPEHAEYVGKTLFPDRYDVIIRDNMRMAIEDAMRNAALVCLETAGYQDDLMDKRRTYANLELALLHYVMNTPYKRYPVWISNANNPASEVGIEIPFTLYVDFEHASAKPLIYTGRIDGLHTNGDNLHDLIVQENKTASRLDDAWRMSFEMSHQVTGYTVAASCISHVLVRRAMVFGVAIPLPKDTTKGYTISSVSRDRHMIQMWSEWLYHTYMLYQQYVDDPINAPKYTHSCNRYFRPCAFIPLCTMDQDDRRHIFENEMVHDEWTPLDTVQE